MTTTLVAHSCLTCAALPELPEGITLPPGARRTVHGYRPRIPRPIDQRSTPRRPFCTEHQRADRVARKATERANRKERKFGVSREDQALLWIMQGCACPCGAKSAPEVPAGVAMDHDHELAAQHDHPDDQGCPECVLGFLCPSCNREIIGRLTGRRRGDRAAGRAGALVAVRALAEYLEDPPMARLRRERARG